MAAIDSREMELDMQQVLKSRAILQQHNDASALRGCMDCGECSTHRIIEPIQAAKTWFGMDHEPYNASDLLSIKEFAIGCAVAFAFVYAFLSYGLG